MSQTVSSLTSSGEPFELLPHPLTILSGLVGYAREIRDHEKIKDMNCKVEIFMLSMCAIYKTPLELVYSVHRAFIALQ